MYDLLRLAVTAKKVRSDQRVRAFDLVIDGLADVMQRSPARGSAHAQTPSTRHEADNVRDLHGVMENILRKAVAKLEAPEQLHDFGMYGRQPCLLHGFFPGSHARFVYLSRNFCDDLFDARGVNAAI